MSSKLGAVLRVTSGNFLEQFDFFLFGFYASDIAKAFFPAQDEVASLLSTFAVFGAGFLMRPLAPSSSARTSTPWAAARGSS